MSEHENRGPLRSRNINELAKMQLQQRYDYQIRLRRLNQSTVDRLIKLVAYTWIPGRYRTVCPPIVQLHEARFLVMHRFEYSYAPDEMRLAIALHQPALVENDFVEFASPQRIKMFKDFFLRPRASNAGKILHENNKEIFGHALDMDATLEYAATTGRGLQQVFTPPQLYAGFDSDAIIEPVWNETVQRMLIDVFRPDAPTLPCFKFPGGQIDEIQHQDNFVIIEYHGDTCKFIDFPDWCVNRELYPGQFVPMGAIIADLPREHYTSIAEINNHFSMRSLEWLMTQVLRSRTEYHTIDELRHTGAGQGQTCLRTWKCVPFGMIQKHTKSMKRLLLDMRPFLGRTLATGSDPDVQVTNRDRVAIHVLETEALPTQFDLRLSDGVTWAANLVNLPEQLDFKENTNG